VTIPGRWWAAIFYPTAKPAETFTAQAGADTAPKVDFNKPKS
jgi:LemA protein